MSSPAVAVATKVVEHLNTLPAGEREVEEARSEVLASGGSAVGEIVTLNPSPERTVTWCYVRDPEGNVVELQSWS